MTVVMTVAMAVAGAVRGASRFAVEIPFQSAVTQCPSRETGYELGFVRPYGKPYGLFASRMEKRTVQHGQGKSEGVLGIAGSGLAALHYTLAQRGAVTTSLAARFPVADCAEEARASPAMSG